jgi:chromosome segregation ATPase
MNEKQLKKSIAEIRKRIVECDNRISKWEIHKREFPARAIMVDGNIATVQSVRDALRTELRELLGERDERKKSEC